MSLHHMLRAAAGQNNSPTPPASTDPQFNYVSMLLHGDGTNGSQNNTFVDSSTNNFTITRNGNTTQGSLSPYGNLWSNYFDGSGDYISAPANTAFDFGTGDFTIEAWVYLAGNSPQDNGGRRFANIFSYSDSSTIGGFFISGDSSTTGIGLQLYNDPDLASVSGTIPQNQWNHIAVSRSGNSVRFFLNGTQMGATATFTGSFGSSTLNVQVGRSLTSGYTFDLNGYVSNIRIVKGTALYTSNFTPSTTPLTAVSGTSLLTCQSNRFIDNSANNFTITRNGDVRVTKEAPFLPTAAYSTSTIGGSGYFDGNGDWLQVPSSSAFNIPTSTTPFTIEAWIYPTTTGGVLFSEIFTGSGTVVVTVTMSDGSLVQNTNGRYIAFGWFDGTNWITAAMSSSQVSLNSWSHVAVVFTGSTSKIFVNGVDVTKSSSPTPATSWGVTGTNGDGCYIGRRWDTFADIYFTGYISNLRFVNGTAVYTAAFTPPTAPLTAITNTSLLLNFTNAGIFDNAAENDLETVGNAQISTSVKKYGTGSLAFDGTGDWLLVPDNTNLQLGSGSFTVEGWVNLALLGSARGLVSKGTSTTGWSLSVNSLNQVVFTDATTAITTTTTLMANTWYHVAVVRSGTGTNQTVIYIDGVSSATGTSASNFNQTNPMYIGADRTGGSALNGYIDDLRITKGFARYTAAFTPPTAAFPDQ